MKKTPRANRLHIAVFGRRNVGKSSLINALTEQQLALVSEVAGTTGDPVYKSMELIPFGPVVMIDTAGIDDEGQLGEMRVKKTKEVMRRTDLALLVFDQELGISEYENNLFQMMLERDIPVIPVINKNDLIAEQEEKLKNDIKKLEKKFIAKNYDGFVSNPVLVSEKKGDKIDDLKEKIIDKAHSD